MINFSIVPLALRHQLSVLQRKAKKPRLKDRDRILWTLLSCFWADWRKALVLVKPETVIQWHRKGFRSYWSWKSRPKGLGRPKVPLEIRDLIRQMSEANPLYVKRADM